jgi:hypothetical protein
MEHDVVLTREDGSKKHFRVYGRPTPNVGDIVTLPIDGRLIKARIGKIPGVASADHVDAAEIESTEPA